MQTIQCSEHYTDRGNYGAMTRMTALKDAQFVRIADNLRRSADDLVFSTNSPIMDNCRIAGTMLGWAFSLDPVRIGTPFDF